MSHSSPNPSRNSYLQSALDAAATRTYRLAARFGLSPADREDLQQELISTCWNTRISLTLPRVAPAFTGMVSKHRSIEFLDRLMKDRSRLDFVGHLDPNNDDEVDYDTFRDSRDPDDHNIV